MVLLQVLGDVLAGLEVLVCVLAVVVQLAVHMMDPVDSLVVDLHSHHQYHSQLQLHNRLDCRTVANSLLAAAVPGQPGCSSNHDPGIDRNPRMFCPGLRNRLMIENTHQVQSTWWEMRPCPLALQKQPPRRAMRTALGQDLGVSV